MGTSNPYLMHRIILMLAFGLLAHQASGRNGFYVSPSAGVGVSRLRLNYLLPDGVKFDRRAENVLSYNATLGMGYNYKKWRLEMGLQYALTGYQVTCLSPGFPDNTRTTTRYEHLNIPLRLGYNIGLNNRLSFVPYAGIVVGYNIGARTITNYPPAPELEHGWSADEFKNSYNRFYLSGSLALRLEYMINHRISIFSGPSAQYMLTRFMKMPSEMKPSENIFMAHMDLGLKVNF